MIPEIKMSEAKEGKSFNYYLKKAGNYAFPNDIISINTNSLFKGNLDMLKKAVKKYKSKSIFRKDFIMIPRQIDESIKAGANYILLLVEYLSRKQLKKLIEYCNEKKIAPILEVNNYINFKEGHFILVNSRDLNTGKINKKKARKVCKRYKNDGHYTIYASGENSENIVIKKIAEDILIGTAFMKEKFKW